MSFIRIVVPLALAVGTVLIGPAHASADDPGAPAYVLVESISVTDTTAFEQYQALARDSIAKHGGQFLARGAGVEYLEGEDDESTLGLLQFPSVDAAREWFTSPDYQEALNVRRSAGAQRIAMVEGSEAATPSASAPRPAFVFVESISIRDNEAFGRYQSLARAAIANHGGQFLARGANVEFLEGQGDTSTLGLLEFSSPDAAKEWFNSPEYQEALNVRRMAGEQRIAMVEGATPPS